MSRSSDTGHAKNIAHFEQLHSICLSFGRAYNPGQPHLAPDSLNALLASARDSMSLVIGSVASYNDAVNTRRQLFEPIGDLSVRLVNSLIATRASKQTIADAKGFNRKIHGTRSARLTKADAGLAASTTAPATDTSAPPTPVEPTRHHSSSQASFDYKIDHLAGLVSLLSIQPGYTPNEPELQLQALRDRVEALRQANHNVFEAYSRVSGARIFRNNTLYLPEAGLIDVANGVKSYIKSVFGPSSQEYKLVSRLSFKKNPL